MVYIRGLGYIGSPQELLQNEWVIFTGIFLLTFAVVYFALRNFFSDTKKASWQDVLTGGKDKRVVSPAAAIIAGVIAFFTASSASRYGPFYDYFAAVIGGWMLLFVLIVLFLISLPFFKMFKSAGGSKWYVGFIMGIALAVAYWFLLKSYFFYNAFAYSYIGWSVGFYEFLISSSGLVVLMLVFAVLGAVLPTQRRI